MLIKRDNNHRSTGKRHQKAPWNMEFVDGFNCILGMKWNPEKMNMGNVWSLLLAQVIFRVVVSHSFYFHSYLGTWSNLTSIFEVGWNHQLVLRRFQTRILGCDLLFKIPVTTRMTLHFYKEYQTKPSFHIVTAWGTIPNDNKTSIWSKMLLL